MADIVSSRTKPQRKLSEDLIVLVNHMNNEYSSLIISPLTITLGDEFQGVCKSSDAAVELLLLMEEFLLKKAVPFTLRYVVLEGDIDTDINYETSHGMLGKGLTDARNKLNSAKKSSKSASFFLVDKKKSNLLDYLFKIICSINYNKDYKKYYKKYTNIMWLFLYRQLKDSDISGIVGKTRSEIWKFRKNWNVEIYISAINIVRERLYE